MRLKNYIIIITKLPTGRFGFAAWRGIGQDMHRCLHH